MRKKIKAQILRPFLMIKWWFMRRRHENTLEMRTISDVLTKRDEVHARFLKQEREGDTAGKFDSLSIMKTLDWVLMRAEK